MHTLEVDDEYAYLVALNVFNTTANNKSSEKSRRKRARANLFPINHHRTGLLRWFCDKVTSLAQHTSDFNFHRDLFKLHALVYSLCRVLLDKIKTHAEIQKINNSDKCQKISSFDEHYSVLVSIESANKLI